MYNVFSFQCRSISISLICKSGSNVIQSCNNYIVIHIFVNIHLLNVSCMLHVLISMMQLCAICNIIFDHEGHGIVRGLHIGIYHAVCISDVHFTLCPFHIINLHTINNPPAHTGSVPIHCCIHLQRNTNLVTIICGVKPCRLLGSHRHSKD